MPKTGNRFTASRFYEIPRNWAPDADLIKARVFVPTGPTQQLSVGFIPPRGGNEPGDWPFVEVVSGLHVLRLKSQSRSVPKSAIDQEVDKACARIEQETGRKPGRREKKELKEEALQTLLPRSFPRDSESWALVCPRRGVLVVNSASSSAVLPGELVAAHASKAQDGPGAFYVRPLRTKTPIESFMLKALTVPEEIAPFGPSTLCVLSASDESKRQVSYRNHQLQDNPEIIRHLQMGHLPTRLGLYLESHTHFEVDDHLGLHKITFTGDLFAPPAGQDKETDSFDADIAIFGMGLFKVYDELMSVLGTDRQDDLVAQSPF